MSVFAERAIGAARDGEWSIADPYAGLEDFLAGLCVAEVEKSYAGGWALSATFSGQTKALEAAG